MTELVLAFDIEHSGTEVIAIGASVVDSNFKELDRFLFGNYTHGVTNFSERCWREFWSKNEGILKIIKYTGNQDLPKKLREKEMITQFQNFRSKWDGCCSSNSIH